MAESPPPDTEKGAVLLPEAESVAPHPRHAPLPVEMMLPEMDRNFIEECVPSFVVENTAQPPVPRLSLSLAVAELTAPRRLLARLRDIMAGAGTGQVRLDRIIGLIAVELGCEVCACFIERPGEVLELFAATGLNPHAVHKTRLRVGEGITGDIAAHPRPVALRDARANEHYVFRPEMGEDNMSSYCGVPIIRGGRVKGVLFIESIAPRDFGEVEIETLQNVAMILAELIAGGELVRSDEYVGDTDAGALVATRLDGVGLSPGLAIGRAVLYQPYLGVAELVTDDPDSELQRLAVAVDAMHGELDNLVEISGQVGGSEQRDIMEAYRLIANDRGWLKKIREAIGKGLSAEAAILKVQDETRSRMAQVTDPYLKERLSDFQELTDRLLMHLSGGNDALSNILPDDVILVARTLGPATLLDFAARRLRGVVIEEGAKSSHVAIVARALQIPVVGRINDVLRRIETFDQLVIDGDMGQVYVRPGEDVIETVMRSGEIRREMQQTYAGLRDLPATSRDGITIHLHINAGLSLDVQHLADTGADGVGLFRTEIPFMVRSAYPQVEDQTALYREVLKIADGKPVVFRTLDVGGDKRLPYFPEIHEDNPALGWRAIRIGLDRPSMLRRQLRALIHAAAGQELFVMFPLVASLYELDAARDLLHREEQRALKMKQEMPTKIHAGVMLEVPALLWRLETLVRDVDFISVGSNDLFQYMFAADRENLRVSSRYDTLSPQALSVLYSIARRGLEANCPISLCGEIAARPLEAMAVIALGFRTLSVSPTAIGPLKAMVRSLDVGQLQDWLLRHLDDRQPSLRTALRMYARDHGIALDDS